MRRRAFTLIEVLSAVILLSAFTLISARVFSVCIQTTRDARKEQVAMVRFDAAMKLLRHDVWNSTNIQADGNRVVVIQQSTGQTITWRLDAASTLVRTPADAVGASVPRWPEFPAIRFQSQPAMLLVRISGQQADTSRPEGEISMVSALTGGRGAP